MYGTLTDIGIAFIILTLLTVTLNRWILWSQGIVKAIPDKYISWKKYPWTFGYFLTFAIAMLMCWRLDFNLFAALTHPGRTVWDGYGFTSLIMSGGSTFLVKEYYGAMDSLPAIVRGGVSTLTSMFSNSATATQTQLNTEVSGECLDENQGEVIK